LEDMHRKLRAAIVGLTPRELDKTPRGSQVSNAAIIAGIAAHDIYHTGQIQLLKRLCKSRSRAERTLVIPLRQRSSRHMARPAR
jgi:uncharacterized damage-inducible protein DinB